jgi:hypothetical protein
MHVLHDPRFLGTPPIDQSIVVDRIISRKKKQQKRVGAVDKRDGRNVTNSAVRTKPFLCSKQQYGGQRTKAADGKKKRASKSCWTTLATKSKKSEQNLAERMHPMIICTIISLSISASFPLTRKRCYKVENSAIKCYFISHF